MSHLVPQRHPESMSNDLSELFRLLDETAIAHVSVARKGRPFVFGTLMARMDDRLVIHGSAACPWVRHLTNRSCAVAITKVDGIAAARSPLESSMLCRSALILGRFAPVSEERQAEALLSLKGRLIPSRPQEADPSLEKELATTLLLEMPIEEWSLTISDDWPEDPADGSSGDVWTGKIRFSDVLTELEPAPGLGAGVEPSETIHAARAAARNLL